MGMTKAATGKGGLPRRSITATNEGRLMQFREKIRFLREREDLTQYDLADLLIKPGAKKVWQNRMSQLENPTKSGREIKIEPSWLLKIAEIFNVPVHWLIDPRLGLEYLTDRPNELERLTEIERQILVSARLIGPTEAMSRLLNPDPAKMAKIDIDPETGLPTGTTGHEPAAQLKTEGIAKPKLPDTTRPPEKPGKGGNGTSAGPKKKPRRPKSRFAHMGAKLTRPRKK